MAACIASSPLPTIRLQHFRQSLYHAGCCKLRDRVSQGQERRNKTLLRIESVNNLHSFYSSFLLNSFRAETLSKMRRRSESERTGSEAGLARSSLLNKENEVVENVSAEKDIRPDSGGGNGGNSNGTGDGGGGGGGGGDAVGWISSALMFGLWAGFILYAFTVAPNQTQVLLTCT
jgi:hypothetical protein